MLHRIQPLLIGIAGAHFSPWTASLTICLTFQTHIYALRVFWRTSHSTDVVQCQVIDVVSRLLTSACTRLGAGFSEFSSLLMIRVRLIESREFIAIIGMRCGSQRQYPKAVKVNRSKRHTNKSSGSRFSLSTSFEDLYEFLYDDNSSPLFHKHKAQEALGRTHFSPSHVFASLAVEQCRRELTSLVPVIIRATTTLLVMEMTPMALLLERQRTRHQPLQTPMTHWRRFELMPRK
jgi:hypothetical protein